MHILRHNDVDNYPSTYAKYKNRPTKDDLCKTLKDYYNDAECSAIADELLSVGIADVHDGNGTVFELEQI